MNTIYLTKEGRLKLQEEHRKLKTETIPAIAARINDARQLGDLSENAEYHTAKEDLAWANTRLVELEATLNNAELITTTPKHDDRVNVGSTITVEWNGTKKQFTIVGPAEVDPRQGKISNESPLGRALLDKHTGDVVEVAVPGGTRSYRITHIT